MDKVTLNCGKTILSHEGLGISLREWLGLIGMAVALDSGILPMHAQRDRAKGEHIFNLATVCEHDGHCGTVGCIGGYVGLMMGMGAEDTSRYVDTAGLPLSHLYYPNRGGAALSSTRVTPKQAAKAICNVLEHGQPRWSEIIPRGAIQPKLPEKVERYAGPILSHEKLKISFKEWLALIAIRAALESGAIEHNRDAGKWGSGGTQFLTKNPGVHVFNMANCMSEANCGTVGCIGGYMGTVMFDKVEEADSFVRAADPSWFRRNARFTDLFYPPRGPSDVAYETITAAQAVRAIDNFLTTGKPKWAEVLAR